MSVRSKALRFAILFGAMASLSACAVNRSSTTPNSGRSDLGEASAGASTDPQAATGGSDIEAAASPMVVESTRSLASGNASGQLSVEQQTGAGFSRYNVGVASLSEEPTVDVITLSEPPRLVLDILGQPGAMNKQLAVDADPYISGIRIGSHKDRTRVVFDLKEGVSANGAFDHLIDTSDGTVAVTFLSDRRLASAASSAPAPVSADLPAADEQMPAEVIAEEAVVAAPAIPPVEPAVEEVEVADSRVESRSGEAPTLDTLRFEKGYNNSGNIVLGFDDRVAFELKRTAPSEYVLTAPGVEAAERTTLPQIAPKGFPGIRSARAVEEKNQTIVRMFVDPTVELYAQPRGNEIVLEARNLVAAGDPAARAQLDPAAGGDAPAADESTARLNPTGIPSADGSKIYTGRLISLDLQDTDIDNALRIIAEVSNLNIIASDDVSGKVTLRLIDVPWDQALDVILKTNGLDQVTEGNVIRIAPVDKLRQEREALREAKKAADQLEDLTVQYIRVSYARATEMVEQVQSVLSERGTVTEDERTNQLIIKDIKKGHELSLELIRRLDLRTPQVLLETQIIEGQRNILRDLGFQWNFTYVASPETGNATGYNFPNSVVVGGSADSAQASLVNFPAILTDTAGSAITAVLDSADGSRSLSARLSALETEGKVRVVSRPQVATVNNKTASIKAVETVRVRLPDSGTSVATGAGANAQGGGQTAFEEIDVGIELEVTPQASPDYFVLMDIEAKSSTFGSTVVDNIPSTLEREATSTILVKSGQTFALGGVYRIEDTDQVQGVPFLKDLPVLGVLFRRSFIDKSDEELIFFITPHIVEGSFDPSLM